MFWGLDLSYIAMDAVCFLLYPKSITSHWSQRHRLGLTPVDTFKVSDNNNRILVVGYLELFDLNLIFYDYLWRSTFKAAINAVVFLVRSKISLTFNAQSLLVYYNRMTLIAEVTSSSHETLLRCTSLYVFLLFLLLYLLIQFDHDFCIILHDRQLMHLYMTSLPASSAWLNIFWYFATNASSGFSHYSLLKLQLPYSCLAFL